MKTPDENVRNDIFSKIVPSDCLVFMIKWLIRMYQGNPLVVTFLYLFGKEGSATSEDQGKNSKKSQDLFLNRWIF